MLYGVKTGLNEAFVIDERTRLRLLDDPRSVEIIKPFVRGRDVAKWTTQRRGERRFAEQCERDVAGGVFRAMGERASL